MIDDSMKERLFVRSARGDGSGIISMPAELQKEARDTVLDHWTEWSVAYLAECGHHPWELAHARPSLREALARWWDERNSFDTPEDAPQLFEAGREWRVFWRPSKASPQAVDSGHDANVSEEDLKKWAELYPEDDRKSEWDEEAGVDDDLEQIFYERGWKDAVREMTSQQEARRPNFCERVVSMLRGRRSGQDAG
jgi:hypothetical protein